MTHPTELGRCDEEVARLLPWFVAGRLEAVDAERVARHLERCLICRDDVAHERTLRASLRAESSVHHAPQPGLAKTLARIDELEREVPGAVIPGARPAPAARGRISAVYWLAAAALVQAVALAALGTAFYHRSGSELQARYTTLTTAPRTLPVGAHLRIVFAPELPVGTMQALLAANRLNIVDGPSEAGAYTLAFTDAPPDVGRLTRVAATLRADARVMFVEPVVNDMAGSR